MLDYERVIQEMRKFMEMKNDEEGINKMNDLLMEEEFKSQVLIEEYELEQEYLKMKEEENNRKYHNFCTETYTCERKMTYDSERDEFSYV